MRIEQRSNVADFFELVEQRRERLASPVLELRESLFRGEWRVEVRAVCKPEGLRRVHELKLVVKVGRYLDNVPGDVAWDVHCEVMERVGKVVRAVRRGGADAGLRLKKKLTVSDLVRANRPRSASAFNAPMNVTCSRLGAALAQCLTREAA